MSANYKPQGTDVTVLDNPNIINVQGIRRVPAIVGLGPSTITVVDEPIVRGTGSVDYLSANPATILYITKVANTPGVTGGLSYSPISANGNLYAAASASVSNPGGVAWSGGGVNVPATGSIYYISYTHSPLASQYDPIEFFDKDSIVAKFGEENATTGILSIAGSIALENGSPSVILVQASGSAYSEAAYKTAIDKLQKKSNISYVSAVFPSGSVTRANQESLLTYLLSHAQLMSNNKKERGFISGSPSTYFASSGGFDSVGDVSTDGSYVYRANALKNKNNIYVVPSRTKRKDPNNNYMELDGNFAAVAVAGVFAARDRESIPVNGYTVVGIEIENEKWSESETNQLGAAGCLVLESISNIVTIKRSLTTDPTSADTQEPSVVDIQRLVKRTLRDGLTNTYTNKGKVITPSTPNDVVGTTISILQSLINDGEIFAYGTQDNPLTGETKINAKQNAQEPRMIDVTCSYKPLYPLIWINATVSVFV